MVHRSITGVQNQGHIQLTVQNSGSEVAHDGSAKIQGQCRLCHNYCVVAIGSSR